jgi:histone acetyltransferase
MDLETLGNNVNNGKYKNKESFEFDLKLIFKNAKTYNQQTTIYYKSAVMLEEFAEQLIKNLKYDYDEEKLEAGESAPQDSI